MPRLDEVDLRNEAAAAGLPVPRPTSPLDDMTARLRAMAPDQQEAFRRWVDPNYRQQAMDRALPPSMVEDRNAYLNAKREARQMQLEQQQRRMAEIEARRQQVQAVMQQINQTPATMFQRQGAAGVANLQSMRGFVNEDQARQALLRPKDPGEYRRARAYFDERKQGVGLMETIQQNPVYQAARTEIPYAGQVASALKGGIEATAPVARVLPQTALIQNLGEALPKVPTASGTGAAFAEASVPTEVWMAVMELLPGVGTVPDVIRMAKSGAPDVLRALDNVVGSEAGQNIRRALADETGSLTPGKFLPGDEGKSLVPDSTSSGIEQVANRFREGIRTARKLGPEQAKMISEQKAQRVGGAAARLEQGGGLKAFHESKSFLAGEYEKPTFAPLSIPAEDVDAMVDHISAQSGRQYFDRLGALTAIEKWTMGVKPADNELDKLESFIPGIKKAVEDQAMSGQVRGVENYGELSKLPSTGQQTRLADSINEAYVGAIADSARPEEAQSLITKALQKAVSPLGLIKTIKTSFDIGWGGRQGWRLLPSNPAEWLRMYGRQFKALRSTASSEAMDAETRAFANFARSQKAERPLAYLQTGTGNPETSGEEFMSGITKKLQVKIFGHEIGLAGFERAFVHPGNWMRQAVLDKQVRHLVEQLGRPLNDAEFQLLIDNINNATLRGNTKWLGHNANTLGSLLFSLKGQVSGPQFLADAFRTMGRSDIAPEVTRQVQKQVGSYVALGMTTLGMIAVGGYGVNKQGVTSPVNVDLNWKSPTFGQINAGGFRWNYWGADQPFVRFVLGMYHNAGNGDEQLRLTRNMVRSKLAPGIPALAWDEFVNRGRNPYAPYGDGKINTPKGAALYALNQTVPIVGEATLQAYLDLGPAAAVASGLANISGLSTSTYEVKPTETQKQTDVLKPYNAEMKGDDLWPKTFDKAWADPVWDAYAKDPATGVPSALGNKKLSDFKDIGEVKDAYIDYWYKKFTPSDYPSDVGMSEKARRAWLGSEFAKKKFAVQWEKRRADLRLEWWKARTPEERRLLSEQGIDPNETEKKALGIR